MSFKLSLYGVMVRPDESSFVVQMGGCLDNNLAIYKFCISKFTDGKKIDLQAIPLTMENISTLDRLVSNGAIVMSEAEASEALNAFENARSFQYFEPDSSDGYPRFYFLKRENKQRPRRPFFGLWK